MKRMLFVPNLILIGTNVRYPEVYANLATRVKLFLDMPKNERAEQNNYLLKFWNTLTKKDGLCDIARDDFVARERSSFD